MTWRLVAAVALILAAAVQGNPLDNALAGSLDGLKELYGRSVQQDLVADDDEPTLVGRSMTYEEAELEARKYDAEDEDELLRGIPAEVMDTLENYRRSTAVDDFMELVEEKRGSKVKSYEVKMCFFCDTACQSTITNRGQNVDAFFKETVGEMNRKLKKMPKRYAWVSEHLVTLKAMKIVPLESYEQAKYGGKTYYSNSSPERLAELISRFWNDPVVPQGSGYSSLYDISVANGCNVDFIILDGSDHIFKEVKIDGVAAVGMACTKSYGGIKIQATPQKTASLLTHEFGHLIGIYHDGKIDTAYSNKKSTFDKDKKLKKKYGKLAKFCKSSADFACKADNNRCMMTGSALSASTELWSKCSLAYFDIYVELTKVVPNYYNVKCIEAKKKREVDMAPLHIEQSQNLPVVMGTTRMMEEWEERAQEPPGSLDAKDGAELAKQMSKAKRGLTADEGKDLANQFGGINPGSTADESDAEEERRLLQSLAEKIEAMIERE